MGLIAEWRSSSRPAVRPAGPAPIMIAVPCFTLCSHERRDPLLKKGHENGSLLAPRSEQNWLPAPPVGELITSSRVHAWLAPPAFRLSMHCDLSCQESVA